MSQKFTPYRFAKAKLVRGHKTIHVLNWFYGNICTKKCYDDQDKQNKCYEKMKKMIKKHEDYLIYHKIFIRVIR